MSIKTAIARTIKRLNLHGIVMTLPIFGKAVYDALSCEFDRVNEFRGLVRDSSIPNKNMDDSTVDDFETKYGIDPIFTDTLEQRIDKIIERAKMDGAGGPDWLQGQIQEAGFPLYVILNEKNVSSVPNFGNFQFSQVQFGGSITYTDPRTIDGELVASSPNGNIGPLFENFGSFQFGDSQFGQLVANTSNPRPRPFTITSDPNKWGYFFFLSPFPDRVAGPTELLGISDLEWTYLRKMILQLKYVRNWAIVQIEIV